MEGEAAFAKLASGPPSNTVAAATPVRNRSRRFIECSGKFRKRTGRRKRRRHATPHDNAPPCRRPAPFGDYNSVRRTAIHIHILGICGTFMGGLALIARSAGHVVTGCD